MGHGDPISGGPGPAARENGLGGARPRGRTVAEKILSAHAGADARAGDMVVCEADLILGTDGSTPMAIQYFRAMGGKAVRHPERVLLARDHYSPPTTPSTLGFHALMEAFAAEHGVELLPVGGGISFQVALETGRVGSGARTRRPAGGGCAPAGR